MEMNWNIVGYAQLFIILWMTLFYLVQYFKKDMGVIDVGWTSGIGIVAVIFALTADGPAWRRALIAALAAGWALRLCYYILVDRIIGKEEDQRYRKLRDHWGAKTQLYFFLTFEAQAILIVLFGIPLWIAMHHPSTAISLFDMAAVAIWLISVVGETIADRQLARFRARSENKGKTCRDGMWRYSRHPNYFFEWLHWWSYVAVAVGAPLWGLSLLGPALMLLFLFKVTGIPYTEKQALSSRGDDYREYQKTTSVFIPWFPKGATS